MSCWCQESWVTLSERSETLLIGDSAEGAFIHYWPQLARQRHPTPPCPHPVCYTYLAL